MNATDADITARLETAVSAAGEAGRLTLDYFRSEDLAVERKADGSPVTVADRQSEQLLRERISAAFPDDGILGEELPEKPGTSGFRWILDPIDGTKSFISGVPLYATLVGVERDGKSLVGVIEIPALAERVYAGQGQGAWHVRGDGEPRPARVSSDAKLSEGLFVTSQVDSFVERDALDAFLQLERAARITRTWGDAYGYLLVATGRALVMVDPVVSVWDVAAMQPILEEAGGTLTDWRGEPTFHHGEGIGTNGRVLDEVLAITRPYSPAAPDAV